MANETRQDHQAPESASRRASASDGVASREEDLGAILDALPAMVGYWDTQLRNRIANRAYLEFFGLTPDQIRGRHIRELLGQELYELNRPHIERALAGEPQLFARTITDPAGQARHTQASYIPDVKDGEVRGFTVLVTDITARRIAERAHEAAESRFRDLLESAPDAMVIIKADRQGEIVLVNARAETIFGYTRDELLGRHIEMLLPERFHERHVEHRSEYARHPDARSMGVGLELYARRKDGTEFPVEISLARLNSPDGMLLSSAIRDITDRKMIEDELRRSRERLAEAERVAGIGSAEWDLINDHVTWSDGLLAIYGLTAEKFDPTSAGADGRVFPDDRQRVRQTLDRAIEERSSFALEYRAVRADGRVRTLHSHGEVVVNDEGDPIRIVAIVQDMTEAKRAQEALQSTSADLERRAIELQQLALHTAPEPQGPPQAPLTRRQLEILQLIAQGHTNATIAERLFVTEGTIKWHVKQILAKTNSSNRAEAVARILATPE